MPNTYVVLNVHGGIIQDVFVSDPECEVLLVDWDTDECDPVGESIHEVPKDDGGYDVAHVARFSTEPMSRLVGTDVERAVCAAGIDLQEPQ